MSLIAILAVMTIFAIALLAIAPGVQVEVQREKELEAMRRGREIADAINQYVTATGKLPNSIDELLEGIPQGTKKKQILRPSSATDPLSEDGKWLLVKVTPQTIANFAKRVQKYNGGQLPDSPKALQQYAVSITSIVDTGDDEDLTAPSDETDSTDYSTDNTPFIGVVSQSRSRSVITYYGIENHSKWIFTPLFSGTGTSATNNKSEDVNTRNGNLPQQPLTDK